MVERVELLAPARDLETGLAAINSGADAVYLGAARFGAREAAGNDLAAVETLVGYAHRYWARVYITVNTLLYDHELPAAVGLIHQLYEIGVDAMIIQDVGLLECSLPPVALFASTQMHNHTPERVAFLEKVGFQRAILARELSLAEIRRVRAAHPHRVGDLHPRGAVCLLQRAVHHELCAGRAQRQPRAVRPTMPQALFLDRWARRRAGAQPLSAFVKRPQSFGSPAQPAGCRRAFLQDRRQVKRPCLRHECGCPLSPPSG